MMKFKCCKFEFGNNRLIVSTDWILNFRIMIVFIFFVPWMKEYSLLCSSTLLEAYVLRLNSQLDLETKKLTHNLKTRQGQKISWRSHSSNLIFGPSHSKARHRITIGTNRKLVMIYIYFMLFFELTYRKSIFTQVRKISIHP